MRTRNPDLMRAELANLLREIPESGRRLWDVRVKLTLATKPDQAEYRHLLDPDQARRAGNALIEVKRALTELESVVAELDKP